MCFKEQRLVLQKNGAFWKVTLLLMMDILPTLFTVGLLSALVPNMRFGPLKREICIYTKKEVTGIIHGIGEKEKHFFCLNSNGCLSLRRSEEDKVRWSSHLLLRINLSDFLKLLRYKELYR